MKYKNNLYLSWAIARKDIVDALMNKSSRTNIIVVIGMIVMFYWLGTVRSFDKKIDVVVHDEGDTGLFSTSADLSDGYNFRFFLSTQTIIF